MKKNQRVRIGLDIGTGYIKLVEAEEIGDELRIYELRMEKNPSWKKEKEEEETISQVVKELVERGNLRSKKVFSSLSGPQVVVQFFEFPPLSPEELKGAVRLEAEQVISSGLEGMDTDFQVVEEEGERKKLRVLFVAAPKVLSDRRIRIIQGVRLSPGGITIDSLAVVKTFLSLEKGVEDVILLNIGAKNTNLAILSHGKILLVRDIPFGGDDLSEEVAKSVGVNFWEGEKIKKNPTLHPQLNLAEITQRKARRLIREIESSLEYYRTRVSHPTINRIYITGGGAKLKVIEDFLFEGLGIEVNLFNPLQRVNLQGKWDVSFVEEAGPHFTVSLGLSLGES